MRVKTVAVLIALIMVAPVGSASPSIPSASSAGSMAFSVVGSASSAPASNDFGGQATLWQCHKFAPGDTSCPGSFTLVAGKLYSPNINIQSQESVFTGKITITISDTDDDPYDGDPVHYRTRVCYELVGFTSLTGVIPGCSESGYETLRAGPGSISVSVSSAAFAGSPSVGPWSWWGVVLWES